MSGNLHLLVHLGFTFSKGVHTGGAGSKSWPPDPDIRHEPFPWSENEVSVWGRGLGTFLHRYLESWHRAIRSRHHGNAGRTHAVAGHRCRTGASKRTVTSRSGRPSTSLLPRYPHSKRWAPSVGSIWTSRPCLRSYTTHQPRCSSFTEKEGWS